ncbi:MAG: HlyC/CorC family transporter [Spirochaetales bacterium]|nr:HlyC/CorC family transporter [Spirochaetales bacterium]
MLTQILFLLFLLILSGFFSSSETAFTSLKLYQLELLDKERGLRGKWIKDLSGKPDILLTTLLIGNNLVNIGASALATSLTISMWGNRFVGYTTGILTLVVLIFCEVTPKQMAMVHNEGIALFTVPAVKFLSYLFRPLIWVVTAISNLLISLFSLGEPGKLTLDSLLHLVNMGRDMGIVEDYENRMVKKVFTINDTPVQAIMTHRKDVYCLDKNLSLLSVYEEVVDSGRSRIPVYHKDPENIVGIVLLQDLIKAVLKADSAAEALKLKDLMIEPFFVPENRRVNELFSQFKKEKLNIAVVLDEYGGLAGVVTQQDVIEEIFGHIADEDEEHRGHKIRSTGNHSWELQGDTDFFEIREVLGLDLEHDRDTMTLGGYLIDQWGEIPETGATLRLAEGFYRIVEAENNRIVRVEFNSALREG